MSYNAPITTPSAIGWERLENIFGQVLFYCIVMCPWLAALVALGEFVAAKNRQGPQLGVISSHTASRLRMDVFVLVDLIPILLVPPCVLFGAHILPFRLSAVQALLQLALLQTSLRCIFRQQRRFLRAVLVSVLFPIFLSLFDLKSHCSQAQRMEGNCQ